MALKNDLDPENESGSWDKNFSISDKELLSPTQLDGKHRHIETLSRSHWLRNILFAALIVTGIFAIQQRFFSSNSNGVLDGLRFSFFEESTSDIGTGYSEIMARARYGEDLLRDMGNWMEEMGYRKLTFVELAELRDKGVTATFTNGIRNLGYDPSLEDIVRLAQHDVTATFARMMHELGYNDLTIDDLVELRDNGVTAFFTSNMHDKGYHEITKEELIRLRSVNTGNSDVQKAIRQHRIKTGDPNSLPTVEDIIRYRISNQ